MEAQPRRKAKQVFLLFFVPILLLTGIFLAV